MNRLRIAPILGLWMLAGAGLGATVILPASLGELAAGAQTIVHGRVVAIEPRWVEGRRQIETLVTLHADEYLKGALGAELTFKVPGGQLGPYRSVMVGAPTFQEGDEIVVFLNASGVKVVVPGVPLAAGGEAEIVRGDPARRRVGLQAFTEQVKALVRDGRAR